MQQNGKTPKEMGIHKGIYLNYDSHYKNHREGVKREIQSSGVLCSSMSRKT